MNTLEQLKHDCQAFVDATNPTSTEFSNLIKAALPQELIDGEVFDVHQSTVQRWASGVAKPLPRLQKLVIREIIKEIEKRIIS